jgi:hypothetical protein
MRRMFLAFLIQNHDQNTIHCQKRGRVLAKAGTNSDSGARTSNRVVGLRGDFCDHAAEAAKL